MNREFEFTYAFANGREVTIIAESKFAAKRKLERTEGITPDMIRRLISTKPKEKEKAKA